MGASSVRVAFETARLQLLDIHAESLEARTTAYRVACKHSARTLNVERVSVWLLTDEGNALSCMLQYRLSTDSFEGAAKVQKRDCPAYFAALAERRVISARDARNNPQTRELASYLELDNIGALLDAPIYRDGSVIGIVCHEHVGGPRDWTEREADFASAVADMLTILLQQAERLELRAAIEAQRNIETQLNKMQALKRLARVVVHDLSNVLTIASLRADALPSESDVSAASIDVVKVLDYGGELLQKLRDFCEERAPSGVVELQPFFARMESVLRVLMGSDVEFELSFEAATPTLRMAPVELEQLLVNLCINAKDAIVERGRVTVRVTEEQSQLWLEVRDTGCGMDVATQARLFEPFYSTKAGHSGIGLSAVYGIVERANGTILLDSSPGRGTRFRIGLPLVSPGTDLSAPWGF
jgi:signal transduction histidine kinase